ncbi:50S ribosomal protein L22, partial [Candidatus Falkowbacteria bacterium]|nr:50S ribosomal protein L22 [Candidatus Falkowbacteria bacterium]
IRGKNVDDALSCLEFLNKLAVIPVKKVLLSAIANAHHNFDIEKSNLKIKSITVDEGPKFKRYMPKAHGRATVIRKRTSHINLVLEEIVESRKKVAKTKAAKKISEGVKVEKKIDNQKDMSDKQAKIRKAEGVKPEIIDVRMQGKRRNKQHQDVTKRADKKFLQKLFNRKSGM